MNIQTINLVPALVAVFLAGQAGVALAQYVPNSVLRNPGASTPSPRRAGPPPATYEPAPPVAPAVRQMNPMPSCVTPPCPAPPVLKRNPYGQGAGQ